MTTYRYKPDYEEAADRATAWWRGEDIGRPLLQVTCRESAVKETLLPLPEIEGDFCPQYTTMSLEYRRKSAFNQVVGKTFLAEAMPTSSVCLGPNCLAAYLGSGIREMGGSGTVWFRPVMDERDEVPREMDDDNRYWLFQRQLIDAALDVGAGRNLVAFPDLIEGLDTLEGLRGSTLLFDLMDDPDWVHRQLGRITALYKQYYDYIYERIRDSRGGSVFWSWAPGKMAKLQCDFSAMIGPDMFTEFMTPVLTDLSEHLDYCMYHWDGPDAVKHHDALLAIPSIDCLQWTPGAGAAPVWHEEWWPLFHKTLDAGKGLYIHDIHGVDSIEILESLKKEFGSKVKRMILLHQTDSIAEGQAFIRAAEC